MGQQKLAIILSGPNTTPQGSDSGTATETGSLTTSIVSFDTATSTETGNTGNDQSINNSDSGSGADASVLTTSIITTDINGTVTEIGSIVFGQISSDTGTGIDVGFAIPETVLSLDSGRLRVKWRSEDTNKWSSATNKRWSSRVRVGDF